MDSIGWRRATNLSSTCSWYISSNVRLTSSPYHYDEMKVIVEGSFEITDETGKTGETGIRFT